MLADRERDGAAGAADLIGELHAGGGGAHYEDSAFGQLLGVSIVERGEGGD